MAVAEPTAGGWLVQAPVLVGAPETLLTRLEQRPLALGLDCPLGLPAAFAARHLPDVPDFPTWLAALAPDAALWQPAATLAEVVPARPFYPGGASRGARRAAHAAALELTPRDLSRLCDRATDERPAGAALFWIVGANQSGRAALHAWRTLVIPALRAGQARLWPFAGPFRSLLGPGTVAIAETYPAEAMRHLGLRPAGSKRRQGDRAAYAPGLRAGMDRLRAAPTAALAATIEAGFGADAAAEDRFDCVLGVLGLIGVIDGHRPDGAPAIEALTRWEGWVLGQTALPA